MKNETEERKRKNNETPLNPSDRTQELIGTSNGRSKGRNDGGQEDLTQKRPLLVTKDQEGPGLAPSAKREQK
jgi:hypothetical protein